MGLADGGQPQNDEQDQRPESQERDPSQQSKAPDPSVLGSGMAERAGQLLKNRHKTIDDILEEAETGKKPDDAQNQGGGTPGLRDGGTLSQGLRYHGNKGKTRKASGQNFADHFGGAEPASYADTDKKGKVVYRRGGGALRNFPKLADGGQTYKSTVDGVPTYSDQQTAGAKPFAPSQSNGSLSVVPGAAVAPAQTSAPGPMNLVLNADQFAQLAKAFSPAPPADGVGQLHNPTSLAPPTQHGIFSRNELNGFNAMANAANKENSDLTNFGAETGQAQARSALQPSTLDFADGGKVSGPGGPTDDCVGPVMLSDKEYVLPADTVQAVGKQNLDKLRAATHDFQSRKAEKSTLRSANGLADGGPPFAPTGNSFIDDIKSKMINNAFAPNGAAPAAPARDPASSQAPSTPVPGLFSKAVSAVGQAGQTADKYLTTPDSAMDNLRNGQAPGGGFVPSGQPNVFQRDNPMAGRPGQSAQQFVGVGPTDQNNGQNDPMKSFRDAMTQLTGTQPQPVDFGAPASNANDINQHFDNLAKSISRGYSARGQGNLARHLIELENARNNALDADARNSNTTRGQDVTAFNAQQELAARMRQMGLQNLATLYNQNFERQMQMNQFNRQMQMNQYNMDRQHALDTRSQQVQGDKNINDRIDSMFTNDGKVDNASSSAFKRFLWGSDPKATSAKLSQMDPQTQEKYIQDQRLLFDQNQKVNKNSSGLFFGRGTTSDYADQPVNVRSPDFNDVLHNQLPLPEYLAQSLHLRNPTVVQYQSGRVAPIGDVGVDSNGNWSQDQLKYIDDQARKHGGKGLRMYSGATKNKEE
jgi:hypothetical protein